MIRVLLSCWLSLLIIASDPLAAQQDRRHWEALPGTAGHAVQALAEDELGLIWLGTASDLLRFDGQRVMERALARGTG
jgi:ligand-binding sensor domain-containing protein